MLYCFYCHIRVGDREPVGLNRLCFIMGFKFLWSIFELTSDITVLLLIFGHEHLTKEYLVTKLHLPKT